MRASRGMCVRHAAEFAAARSPTATGSTAAFPFTQQQQPQAAAPQRRAHSDSFESFGLVFLEAMREGKPVIGCRAGGMPEVVVDGLNGILVPPGDSAALAGAILDLAASAPRRAALGAAGRARFIQHFTAARMAQSSMPLYDLARGRFAPQAA